MLRPHDCLGVPSGEGTEFSVTHQIVASASHCCGASLVASWRRYHTTIVILARRPPDITHRGDRGSSKLRFTQAAEEVATVDSTIRTSSNKVSLSRQLLRQRHCEPASLPVLAFSKVCIPLLLAHPSRISERGRAKVLSVLQGRFLRQMLQFAHKGGHWSRETRLRRIRCVWAGTAGRKE
jgi:hypothetical protein